MLTLIGREIRDNLVYLGGLGFATVFTMALLIVSMYQRTILNMGVPLIFLVVALLLGLCSLGSAQMHGDRAHRISPLLSTLAVTRSRILAARVLVGGLAVLLAFVPVIVTSTLLLRAFVPPLAFYERMLVEVSLTILLAGLACYSVGLLVGWTTNRLWLVGGGALLFVLVLSLVWIKGFGADTMLLLLLVTGALLLRVWHVFTSASL
jgi:hypothetical protein